MGWRGAAPALPCDQKRGPVQRRCPAHAAGPCLQASGDVPVGRLTCARSLTPSACSWRAQRSISARSSARFCRRAARTSASAGEASSRMRPSWGCTQRGSGRPADGGQQLGGLQPPGCQQKPATSTAVCGNCECGTASPSACGAHPPTWMHCSIAWRSCGSASPRPIASSRSAGRACSQLPSRPPSCGCRRACRRAAAPSVVAMAPSTIGCSTRCCAAASTARRMSYTPWNLRGWEGPSSR